MPKKKHGEQGGAAEVFKHVARLKYQDEDWKTRDEALERLRILITNGALATEEFITGEAGYASNIKDLVHSVVTQLFDLRSVIARSAATTLTLLMDEVGDHAAVEAPMCSDALEGLLQLASSANKVLAAAGRDTFPRFIESVRFESIIKDGLLVWLRGNKTPAVKICCLEALLQALQTWPLKLLSPSNEAIEIALVEAASNPLGEIRVLARQGLLQHLVNAPERQVDVDKWLKRYPDVAKQLAKEQPKPGALALEERVAPKIRHGDPGAAKRNGKLGASGVDPNVTALAAAGAGAAKKPSLLRSLSRGVEKVLERPARSLSRRSVKKSPKGGGEGAHGGARVAHERIAALEKAAQALSAFHIDSLSSAEAARIRKVASQLEANLLGTGGGDADGDEGSEAEAEAPFASSTFPSSNLFGGSPGRSAAQATGGAKPSSAMERMQALRLRQHEMSADEYEAERKRILESL